MQGAGGVGEGGRRVLDGVGAALALLCSLPNNNASAGMHACWAATHSPQHVVHNLGVGAGGAGGGAAEWQQKWLQTLEAALEASSAGWPHMNTHAHTRWSNATMRPLT